jgi:hypothetical protein
MAGYVTIYPVRCPMGFETILINCYYDTINFIPPWYNNCF